MNLLLIGEIQLHSPMPEFGADLQAHIEEKRHPRVHAASLTAWNLLARALKDLGVSPLPEVSFADWGKPHFRDHPLHFSIAHSGNLAAVLVSDAPCAVDIEALRPEVNQRLVIRCLSEEERRAGCDFFETWTKKECIGKLSGRGVSAHPAQLNSLDDAYAGCFFTQKIHDSKGSSYALTALCMDKCAPEIQKIDPKKRF